MSAVNLQNSLPPKPDRCLFTTEKLSNVSANKQNSENSNLTKSDNHIATGLTSNICSGIQLVVRQEMLSVGVPPITFSTIR